MARPIQSQDVRAINQIEENGKPGGVAAVESVKFETSDPANDHAWTITQSTPDTPAGVKSDSTPV